MEQVERESIETSAKTVEEAIELGLRELDADRDEVEIDVVSKGKSSILGIGGDDVSGQGLAAELVVARDYRGS